MHNQTYPQAHTQAQKLAGILIELQGDMEGPSVAVIGVGLNLNVSPAMQQSIDQATTDLTKLLKTPVDANQVLATLLTHLTAVLSTFEKAGFEHAGTRKNWLRFKNEYFDELTYQLCLKNKNWF